MKGKQKQFETKTNANMQKGFGQMCIKNESMLAAEKSLQIEEKAVSDVSINFNRESFANAVRVLSDTKRIMTCASGTSGIAAKKFAHSLCCIERAAMFMPPCEAVHGGLGALRNGDVMVMVSRGGKTAELMPIIPVVGKRGATLIAGTENMESPLAKAADIILPLYIEQESDKFNMMATSSFIATIVLFDALICAIMEETDYKREQFGVIHPGGAVGEMLSKEAK